MEVSAVCASHRPTEQRALRCEPQSRALPAPLPDQRQVASRARRLKTKSCCCLSWLVQVTHQFINSTQQAVTLNWVDFEGEEVTYQTLEPGHASSQGASQQQARGCQCVTARSVLQLTSNTRAAEYSFPDISAMCALLQGHSARTHGACDGPTSKFLGAT